MAVVLLLVFFPNASACGTSMDDDSALKYFFGRFALGSGKISF
jgi:hypothetical protein